ncbi:hypothetical protein COCON_G00094530 [Conger conger]|uniref:Uncharacterized protein n=1 Tax=Conger conger TaxID=82655 RepID=A0A9Q1DLN6_CONCO|nr:hypothetical protein COCON_G00094530 [Conger conger]
MIPPSPPEFPTPRFSAMRPSGVPSSPRSCSHPGRALWMWWALTAVGCFTGPARSSSPEHVPGTPPSSQASLSHPGLHGQGVRLPPLGLSVYRSPASLRGGHGESAPACLPAHPEMQRGGG